MTLATISHSKCGKKMATKESTLMITKEEQLLILIATRIIR